LASRLEWDGDRLRLNPNSLQRMFKAAGFLSIEDLGPPQIEDRFIGPGFEDLRGSAGVVPFLSASCLRCARASPRADTSSFVSPRWSAASLQRALQRPRV